MNCAKGDLAVVVAVPAHARHALGAIVRCIDRCDEASNEGLPMWHVDPPAGGLYWGVHDHWLKPIRDPGDDARDETLDWLPVPTTETAAA